MRLDETEIVEYLGTSSQALQNLIGDCEKAEFDPLQSSEVLLNCFRIIGYSFLIAAQAKNCETSRLFEEDMEKYSKKVK